MAGNVFNVLSIVKLVHFIMLRAFWTDVINFKGIVKKTSVRNNHILTKSKIVKHPLISQFWQTFQGFY